MSCSKAVEVVLKGKEMELPEGNWYLDKEGHKRTAIRARWFEKPDRGTLYQAYVLQADPINCAVCDRRRYFGIHRSLSGNLTACVRRALLAAGVAARATGRECRVPRLQCC